MLAPLSMAPRADAAAQWLAAGTAALAAAGIEAARLEAELLLAHACGIDRVALYTRAADELPLACRERFLAVLARRRSREPLAYLLGQREFWSLDFAVSPDVLIPRPETELLVELVAADIRRRKFPLSARVALCDVGTGSGCIAVALARELPEAEIWALDISPAALGIARDNARRHGVGARVHCLQSNLLAAVDGRRFAAIVSNPPYVSVPALASAQPELQWEPRVALDGGADGLAVIRRLLAEVPDHLMAGGYLAVEIGADQAGAGEALARAAGLRDATVRRDYAGRPRVLTAVAPQGRAPGA